MEAPLTTSAGDDPVRVAYDAVIEPFVAFFRANGGGHGGLLSLGMITLYHLCDYMRGPMGAPYYTALHILRSPPSPMCA